MTLEDIFATEKNSVFDNYVPIISTKNTTTVYLTDVIESPSLYNETCYRLDNASSFEKFYIYINTPGGILDAAIMLVNSIKNTKALTIAKLSGTVASAGTIIALACKQLEIADHTAFMVHNYSGGLYGKGHELKAHQEFVDANLNKSFSSFYAGFLTPSEIKKVIDGKDYWMNKDEVLARLGKRTVGDYLEAPSDFVALEPKRRGRPSRKAD